MNAPEVATMPLADLAPAPYNPRTISKKAAAGLRASIRRFGLVQPIVFNRRSGHVVGGHQRIDALKTLGETAAQVVIVDLPESDEKALNVTLNNPGVSGEFSKAIGSLIGEIKLSLPSLDFDELRFDELADPPAVIEDEVPELPKVPVTKPGDLWVLGRHRVLCGDARKAASVARACGAPPACVLTDPPYGQNQEGVPHDSPRENVGLIDSVTQELPASATIAVFFQSPRTFPVVLDAMRARGWDFERMLWLDKVAQCAYPWRGWILKSESILLFSRGKSPGWQDIHPYSHDVYRLPEVSGQLPEGTGWHGSVKPLVVVVDLLRRISGEVYDPFLGSGTTLIAAEQLDRVCYGLEIEPRYCDVIVERWQSLTGQKAQRAA